MLLKSSNASIIASTTTSAAATTVTPSSAITAGVQSSVALPTLSTVNTTSEPYHMTIGNLPANTDYYSPSPPTSLQSNDETNYLDSIQDILKEGWTVHANNDGRLYYCNHTAHTASWLPPAEVWDQLEDLPYGWEKALDTKGQPYYINHLNKTTTFEAPHYNCKESPPEPRVVVLQRSPAMGFGFVAGSERPVIVRFVTEGGPSVGKLEPGDQILLVNGEDVKEAPRDHVIQLVRSCDTTVKLIVCQPMTKGSCTGRKSTLLSAGKKAKLKSRPTRVRFAESVCVNGAPLFPASAFSLGDLCLPPMANVLKVFLENGQTKSFKYDATTTVQDVVTSLRDKLCLTAGEHFSLVLEHVKSLKRNKLTLLDPQETIARIAARPGAHKLRCLFRVTFVPITASGLAQKDLNTLDYLYIQCCNDVTQERFAPELQPDVALRLAALHMYQHSLTNNISSNKLTVKTIEREFGLERFVPLSLIEGMKRKELRRLIGHFLKLNTQLTGQTNKVLTILQSKINYLDIISSLPSYGAKCFSTNQRDGIDRVLLISPRFGLSQITGIRNSIPQPIASIEEILNIEIKRDDDLTNYVIINIAENRQIQFLMDDLDSLEFKLVISGYYKILTNKDLLIINDIIDNINSIDDIAPLYLSQHNVIPCNWNYIPKNNNLTIIQQFALQPPYHSINNIKNCDNNMNTTLINKNHTNYEQNKLLLLNNNNNNDNDFGLNIINNKIKYNNNIIEARNDEVLKRVTEMQKMVENSQNYLNEHSDLMDEYNDMNIINQQPPWFNYGQHQQQHYQPQAQHVPMTAATIELPQMKKQLSSTVVDVTTIRNASVLHDSIKTGGNVAPIPVSVLNDIDSDCESINSSRISSLNDDGLTNGILKHSDSLILLTEAINQDLNTIPGISNAVTEPNKKIDLGVKHNLGKLLNDLELLNNDLSQSESDSESIHTPNTSPIHRQQSQKSHQINNKQIRTSFGLHSPDNGLYLGLYDAKESNLNEYLRQLHDISLINKNDTKTSNLYNYNDKTIIETDPDLIDLTIIPPPQTPDELDALTVLNTVPRGFDDKTKDDSKTNDTSNGTVDFEEFLANVIIAPPGQKITPAKELTPEEILSYIIPPPPTGKQQEEENLYSNTSGMITNNKEEIESNSPEATQSADSSLAASAHVIEYSTIERKGPFSCCTKLKKNDLETKDKNVAVKNEMNIIKLPPKRNDVLLPPNRPPKNNDLHLKITNSNNNNINNNNINNNMIKELPQSPQTTTILKNKRLNGCVESYYDTPDSPPMLPPRQQDLSDSWQNTLPSLQPQIMTLPPKKPPLPPLPTKTNFNFSTFKNGTNDKKSPIAVIGPFPHSLRLHHPIINNNNNNSSSPSSSSSQQIASSPALKPTTPTLIHREIISKDLMRTNGHYRSHSDCPPIPHPDDPPPHLSLLHSPQLIRKNNQVPSSPKLLNKNGYIINAENLLTKTDVAMAGLLVKLDQVAAMCSAAQTAGGGININESKFQVARDELTNQTLQLVTASKLFVISMSDQYLNALPEHLTSCLTSLRRITELTQDLTRYTSSPLQTRNIVLKVHDVAASFRELAGVQIGLLGAGQLALQAECLANVLATLLRSLRVFSP